MPDHQRHIAELLSREGDWPTESVPLVEARGRVLGAAVIAAEALPAFDNSGMDGYAVRADEVATATPDSPVTMPVGDDIPAGAPIGELTPGTVRRIMTGAGVPAGADAVVEVEVTDGGTTSVEIREARPVGSFIRAAGSDVAVGAEVLPAGVTLGPAQLGVLTALGIREVVVRRRPRVLVVSTGSELAEEPAPGSGQIRDANGALLAAAVEEAGGTPVRKLWVEDDVPTFLRLLDDALETDDIDLVLTSGGVSAGAYEVVKDGLGPRGVEFVKVAMQPGMPQGSGQLVDTTPVICLPGNPVSALTSWEVFVRPALRLAFGHPRPHRTVVLAALTEPLKPLRGKRQLRRARLDRVNGTVTPWGPPGSGFLGWFAGADALIDLPSDGDELAVGDPVGVWDLTSD